MRFSSDGVAIEGCLRFRGVQGEEVKEKILSFLALSASGLKQAAENGVVF